MTSLTDRRRASILTCDQTERLCVCVFLDILLHYKLHARTQTHTDIKDHVIRWLMGPCESHSKARGWDQWGGFVPWSEGMRFASARFNLMHAGRMWPVMGTWRPVLTVLTSGDLTAQYEQWHCYCLCCNHVDGCVMGGTFRSRGESKKLG